MFETADRQVKVIDTESTDSSESRARLKLTESIAVQWLQCDGGSMAQLALIFELNAPEGPDLSEQGQMSTNAWSAGHSLGAGVAALMTLRLKDRYPSTKCWAFCPPGGLMSANLSHAAQGFVNCVVVGKDIVPRLSVVNIGRLIDELVRHSMGTA